MKVPIEGGCACGAIRYRCTAQPITTLLCHCRICRSASGSAFAAAVLVPAEAFELLRGTPRASVMSGVDGRIERTFCADCGSPLIARPRPDWIDIAAGSLDGSDEFAPQIQIYVSHAMQWNTTDPDIIGFSELPDEAAPPPE